MPYIILMVVLIVLAGIIYLSNLPEVETPKDEKGGSSPARQHLSQFPHLIAGALTLFMYVGAEVLAGDSIINYGASQGIALSTAKFFTACTMSGMVAGYIIGIICIPRFLKQEKALTISAILGLLFTVMALVTKGYASVFCIALLGLANSLVWPAIWPLSIKGLGSFTKTGSSLLIMGIAGGALIPLIYGRIADVFNLQQAYAVLIPCYLAVFYFSVWGHKLKPKVVVNEKLVTESELV
jgi:FHS family L-fucose permease-like MFS transporter